MAATAAGCSPSSFLARRFQQAPNSYPEWFAPEPLVWYSLPAGSEAAFPRQQAVVGPPKARIAFRIIEPGDYRLKGQEIIGRRGGDETHHFRFSAHLPAPPRASPPIGTAVLLHGYGVDQRVMLPWALRLAESGWRCAICDFRGHGRSTGSKVFFGQVESSDLKEWLDQLESSGRLARPVVVVGESFGAAVALKLAGEDHRVDRVVAMAPYACLTDAILGIRSSYAAWVPEAWVRRAAQKLPGLAGSKPGGLDPAQWIVEVRCPVFFISGSADTITPLSAQQTLRRALKTSELMVVPGARHETLPFQLDAFEAPLEAWLNSGRSPGGFSASGPAISDPPEVFSGRPGGNAP